jgi:hypothetical protein
VLQGSQHVLALELGVVLDDLIDGTTRSELSHDRSHGHARAPDGRQPLHPVRVGGDPLEAHDVSARLGLSTERLLHGDAGVGCLTSGGAHGGRVRVQRRTSLALGHTARVDEVGGRTYGGAVPARGRGFRCPPVER